ncbi:hypothetical protein PV08_07411 [Exophiala spinifera]|uniref:Peptidase A1 domain-containing protein n=1 Tax=Exophiala spinifera TaxID=91928 RepID=A0A0D1ZP96_9EURO|nr:uncharacterized protein PV08_07411 [Exophiala spinifera]KIW14627.1 hypothetical protein PV08_07411 [Exophiala spinifera]
MAPWFLGAAVLLIICLTESGYGALHLPLYRRGGRLSRHETANLTRLAAIVSEVEARYARCQREVGNNRVVRRWRPYEGKDENDPQLIDVAGHQDRWYAELQVGDPPQVLEVDIDMLSPDFYTIMTSSGTGSKYDTFTSGSYEETHGASDRVHSLCRRTSDHFHFQQESKQQRPIRLSFPICTPSKASGATLAHSGTILGLSPDHGDVHSHNALSRLSSPSLLDQLFEQHMVHQRVWSVTLLDAESGILSLGGTIAQQVEEANVRGSVELEHFGDPQATSDWVEQEVAKRIDFLMTPDAPWDGHFKWTNTQGAAGWWTALMSGVWINGAKVLENQPVLFDINVPFILAPPVAAHRFYEAIGGAKRLDPPPFDAFFAIPCLNTVNVAFEIGGWNFPVMAGEGTREDALYGPAGGKVSLGKVGDGTGYCVGAVLETTMGVRDEWIASGVRDMWVLGEPFFRGLGVAFDVEKGRVGVRVY